MDTRPSLELSTAPKSVRSSASLIAAGVILASLRQHRTQRHQSEVIRAIVLEHSLYLLHGLWVDGRLQHRKQRHQPLAEWQRAMQGTAASLSLTGGPRG